MLESVEWCSCCNSRPADGILTIIIDGGMEEEIPACTPCVHDPEKVEFL